MTVEANRATGTTIIDKGAEPVSGELSFVTSPVAEGGVRTSKDLPIKSVHIGGRLILYRMVEGEPQVLGRERHMVTPTTVVAPNIDFVFNKVGTK